VWGTATAAALACVAAFVLAHSSGARRPVWEGSFEFSGADAEKSRVSPVFEVDGRASNLELTLGTNLENRWAYFALALVNEDTDEALDFSKELSYYRGVDDGEAWSEGSSYGRVYIPSVPAGRYYLRVEPEFDGAPLSLTVRARRNVPLLRVLLIALALLLVPALWASMRSTAFEQQRWMESDHPMTSEDDDE
jgi:hypothetical protein